MSALITLANFDFAWPGQTELLDIPNFHLEHGEGLLLKGPSGSGKTILLGFPGDVQKPNHDSIRLLGEGLEKLSAAYRGHFRISHVDYIFQQFNLLPFPSIRKNVELLCHFSALCRQHTHEYHDSSAQAVNHLLGQFGLSGELRTRRTNSLPIGQQQRVAAARVLISQPELVIADESTSALGADSHKTFLQLLLAECHKAGASLLFVSHDQSLAGLFDRSLSLSDLNRVTRPTGL